MGDGVEVFTKIINVATANVATIVVVMVDALRGVVERWSGVGGMDAYILDMYSENYGGCRGNTTPLVL